MEKAGGWTEKRKALLRRTSFAHDVMPVGRKVEESRRRRKERVRRIGKKRKMEGIGKGRMTGIRIVGEILSVERMMAKLKGPLTDNWRHNFRRCGLFFRSLCN